MPIMTLGFLALTLAYSQTGLFIALFVLISSQGICTPGLLALISNRAADDMQGATIGINQSMQSVASAIPPLLAASLVAVYLDFPLIFGAVVTSIAFVVFYLYEFRKS
jgi:MFS family permease